MLELLQNLPDGERAIVINYAISGSLFSLFGYVIYMCKYIKVKIRMPISLLMGAVGFTFLSAAGRILQGYDDTMTSVTQWGVTLSTVLGFWVVVEFWKRNKRKQKGQ